MAYYIAKLMNNLPFIERSRPDSIPKMVSRWAIFCLAAVIALAGCADSNSEPVRIGILNSLSGTMADSESSLVDAALLAVNKINESGGVLGRPVEAVVADGKSDVDVFVREAERLILEEGVVALFGTWTSAHRKAVKSVVEKHGSLLFYPLQYEGIEQSPNIIYMGSTPNQQIIPAVEWCYRFLGPRMYLVGSDYVFPRVANAIIRDKLAAFGVSPAGEDYVPLGGTEFESIIENILQAQPDVILSSINGDSNRAFFRALSDANITADDIPVMSFSLGEPEVLGLGTENLAGHYSAWGYFQSIDASANRAFVDSFRSHFGAERVIGDPMEAIYTSVTLWASAVSTSGSVAPENVKSALYGRTYSAARGAIRVDDTNQHLWQAARIGRLEKTKQFEIVWESGILPPLNYPASRTALEWENLLDELYRGWGENWARPDPD